MFWRSGESGKCQLRGAKGMIQHGSGHHGGEHRSPWKCLRAPEATPFVARLPGPTVQAWGDVFHVVSTPNSLQPCRPQPGLAHVRWITCGEGLPAHMTPAPRSRQGPLSNRVTAPLWRRRAAWLDLLSYRRRQSAPPKAAPTLQPAPRLCPRRLPQMRLPVRLRVQRPASQDQMACDRGGVDRYPKPRRCPK